MYKWLKNKRSFSHHIPSRNALPASNAARHSAGVDTNVDVNG
jgi:hypothetical protein